MENGYLYIASGKNYIQEALISVRSLKAVCPDAHATLITDKEDDIPVFDQVVVKKVEVEKGWKEGILFKVIALVDSPYEKTFFVDTDTYFADDCSELFDLLGFFDLLIAQSPFDLQYPAVNGTILEGYHSYNTGVIVFNKNAAVQRLLEDWLKIYKEKFAFYNHDQTPFMESLLINPIKSYVLQPIYNFRIPFAVAVPGRKVKLFHGRVSDFPSMVQTINHKQVQRAWVPQNRGLILENYSLKKHIRTTLKTWRHKAGKIYGKLKN